MYSNAHRPISKSGALLDAWAKKPDLEGRRLDLRANGDLSSLLPPEALNTNNAAAILAA